MVDLENGMLVGAERYDLQERENRTGRCCVCGIYGDLVFDLVRTEFGLACAWCAVDLESEGYLWD